MVNNSIIIAFSSEKNCTNIGNILTKNGINYDFICKTGTNLRMCCSSLDDGIVICGLGFLDEPIFNIIEDFHDRFIFILIGSSDKINMYEDEKVYKLSTPVKQEEILSAIDISYYKNSENIKNKNLKLIREAKELLIKHKKFTEEQAHKFIQKKSMDNSVKNVEIAKLIIKKYKPS